MVENGRADDMNAWQNPNHAIRRVKEDNDFAEDELNKYETHFNDNL